MCKKQDDRLFAVTQSPKRDKPLTILEFVREIPQYILAYALYLDLCLLHYTITKTRGLFLLVTSSFGLYTDDVNRTVYTTACLIYTAHCLVSILTFKTFLSDEKRLRWFYDHVGEKRVKPKLFTTPLIGALTSAGMRTMLGTALLEGGTHCIRNMLHQSNYHNEAAEYRLNCSLAKDEALAEYKLVQDNPNFDSAYKQKCHQQFKQHIKSLEMARDSHINNIRYTPIHTGGIVAQLINADTARKGIEVAGDAVSNLGKSLSPWGR